MKARTDKNDEPLIMFSVRLPASLDSRLRELAKAERRTISGQAVIVFERGLAVLEQTA